MQMLWPVEYFDLRTSPEQGIGQASATTLEGPAFFYFDNTVLFQCPETLVENIEDFPRCVGILIDVCPVVAFGKSCWYGLEYV